MQQFDLPPLSERALLVEREVYGEPPARMRMPKTWQAELLAARRRTLGRIKAAETLRQLREGWIE